MLIIVMIVLITGAGPAMKAEPLSNSCLLFVFLFYFYVLCISLCFGALIEFGLSSLLFEGGALIEFGLLLLLLLLFEGGALIEFGLLLLLLLLFEGGALIEFEFE